MINNLVRENIKPTTPNLFLILLKSRRLVAYQLLPKIVKILLL